MLTMEQNYSTLLQIVVSKSLGFYFNHLNPFFLFSFFFLKLTFFWYDNIFFPKKVRIKFLILFGFNFQYYSVLIFEIGKFIEDLFNRIMCILVSQINGFLFTLLPKSINFLINILIYIMNIPQKNPKAKLYLLVNKDSKVYFNQNTICQYVQGKTGKILLSLDQNSHFSINKSQKNNIKPYLTIKIENFGHQLLIKIQNLQQFQSIVKNLGKYCYGYGLNAFSQDFVQIGKGNFATVFKSLTFYKTQKAMKMFEKKKLQNTKDKLAFLNQIHILKSLNSPYIVSLDSVFEVQKNYYLQMEYFQETLKTYLRKPISRKEKKNFIKNILLAMKQLKQKNIIHRDIKPENIMVRKNSSKPDQFVLIDFGLAAKANEPQMVLKKCGTPGFIAPQIINMDDKIKIGFQADIFSAGVTFFYMQFLQQQSFCNKKPFSACNYKELFYKNKKMIIEEHLYFSMAEKGKYFSNFQEADLVKKMIQKDPSKRITVEQALRHRYFDEQVDDDDMIPDESCDLDGKLKELKIMDTSFMSKGIQLLYSFFKLANIAPPTKEQDNEECYMDSQFSQLQSSYDIPGHRAIIKSGETRMA